MNATTNSRFATIWLGDVPLPRPGQRYTVTPNVAASHAPHPAPPVPAASLQRYGNAPTPPTVSAIASPETTAFDLVQGLRFRVWVEGLGLRVWVEGLGLRFEGSWVWVWGWTGSRS